MGYSKDYPTALFDQEGFIFLDDKGDWFTNQTGGVSCNHPVAQGHFKYQPIPAQIKRETVDMGYFDQGLRAKLNFLFQQAGIPFTVDDGEEAWAHGQYITGYDEYGQPIEVAAIATWPNSD